MVFPPLVLCLLSSLCTCCSRGLGLFWSVCCCMFPAAQRVAWVSYKGHSCCATPPVHAFVPCALRPIWSAGIHTHLGSSTCASYFASLCCMHSVVAARILPQEANRIRPKGPPVASAPWCAPSSPTLCCPVAGSQVCCTVVLHTLPVCIHASCFCVHMRSATLPSLSTCD